MMTDNDGPALAAAWKAWISSPEGLKCADVGFLKSPADGVYLNNRLWRAFMDGTALRAPSPPSREALVEVARRAILRYAGEPLRPGYVVDCAEAEADKYLSTPAGSRPAQTEGA